MKIELELHEEYFKALDELLLKINKKYGYEHSMDHLVSVIIRKHVKEDLEKFDK
jgi:hypothetical protein